MFLRLSVILSTGEVSAPVHTGIHPAAGQTIPVQTTPGQTPPPWADNPPGQTPPWADTLPGQTHPRADPPGQTHPLTHPLPPGQTATAADGTHSTEMHSCLVLL